jgi:hypothetical protein
MANSTRDLLTGLAQMLADTGIAKFDHTGAYAPGDTAVVFKSAPASPDRVITLTCVPLTDGVMTPLSQWLVQAYVRGNIGDPMDVEDLADAVWDLWQGATNVTLGSTHAIQIRRQGSTGNGQDDKKRWTRIDRYLIDLDTAPTTNRPDMGWD